MNVNSITSAIHAGRTSLLTGRIVRVPRLLCKGFIRFAPHSVLLYPQGVSISEDLAAELREGMRERDRNRTDVIRSVQTEVARAKSAPGFTGEVDDDLYRRVIAAYVKRMDKARREYLDLGDRGQAQVEKLGYEVEYLSRWLPTSLDEDDTRAIARAAIAELGADDPKMAGRVVGHIMRSGVEGLDGGLVNRLVREELGGG